MNQMRVRAGALFGALLIAALGPNAARADDGPWHPVARTAGPPPVVASSTPAAQTTPTAPAAELGRPIVVAERSTAWAPNPAAPAASLPTPAPSLAEPASRADAEAPILLGAATPQPAAPPVAAAIAPVQYLPPAPAPDAYTARFQAPEPPPPSGPPVAQLPPPGAPPPPPPPVGAEVILPNSTPIDQPLKKSFLERCRDTISSPFSKNGGTLFQSDKAFSDAASGPGDLISPVSNPFFFEDPRALTEVRPIFMYQNIPSSNPIYKGGSAYYFGTQARVAFCDTVSLVINKLGFVSLEPKDSDNPDFKSGTGFAEFNIGPKWTFYRNEKSGTIAAAGVTFEIPAGSHTEYQNTGSVGFDPYVSFGQTFGRSSYGTFNFLANGGYSFGSNNERTEYLHGSLHLDYDVANLHKIYPLIEVNWFHTTQGGKNTDIGFEGADLVNYGSSTYGSRDLVTMALGARYKFSEHIQVGTGFEFPLSSRKDLSDFRLTLDLIFRY